MVLVGEKANNDDFGTSSGGYVRAYNARPSGPFCHPHVAFQTVKQLGFSKIIQSKQIFRLIWAGIAVIDIQVILKICFDLVFI